MSKASDEHARQNELKRRKAAELLSAKLRKQQRSRTDEALLKAAAIDPAKTRRPPKEGDT
jgi:hypothetical protein